MARQPRKKVGKAPAPALAELREELYALADPADAIHLQRFFKTAPGEYGAGDKFLGLRVPTLRRLVKEYRELADADALGMLGSHWHEERLLALMLLGKHYREMPRTMLRYAIERHPEKVRKQYLAGTL